MDNHDDDLTHFGHSRIPRSEKTSRVAGVFHSVASRYDIMNDLMSLGTHRVMKLMAANAARARDGHVILDLAGGTGGWAYTLTQVESPRSARPGGGPLVFRPGSGPPARGQGVAPVKR